MRWFLILSILAITSCDTSASDITRVTLEPILVGPSVTNEVSDNQATPASIITPQITPDYTNITRTCIEVIDKFSESIQSSGILHISTGSYLDPDSKHFLDMETGKAYQWKNTSRIHSSPDGSKFLYKDFSNSIIVVEDIVGGELLSIPSMDEKEKGSLGIAGWMNNESIVLSVDERGNDELWTIDSIQIRNINGQIETEFSKESFPNIYDNWIGSAFNYNWLGYSNIRSVISPDGNYAVYAGWIRTDNSSIFPLILFDLRTSKEILRIHQYPWSSSGILGSPTWDAEGHSFITAGPINIDGTNDEPPLINVDDNLPYVGDYSESPHDFGDDLFRITTSGEVERLTYFATTYHSHISSWSLSPDGNRIAFFLHLEDDFRMSELSILDLESHSVTTFCLADDMYRMPHTYTPIWSPDGSQIVMRWKAEIEENPNLFTFRYLIVDLPSLTAVPFDEGAIIGWFDQLPAEWLSIQ